MHHSTMWAGVLILALAVTRGFTETCTNLQHCIDCYDDPVHCEDCSSGTVLSEDELACVDCPSNCDVCAINPNDDRASVCNKCKDLYYETSALQCEECVSNCKDCNDADTCETCMNGYTMDPDGEVRCADCPSHCKSCYDNDECRVCVDEYYLDSNKVCQQCPTDCKTCTSATDCQVCMGTNQKYYDSTANMCKACISNCATCEVSGCTKCDNGYFLLAGAIKCVQATHCSAFADTTGCTACDFGYTLSSQIEGVTTYTSCEACIGWTSTTCAECVKTNMGRYYNNGQCGYCINNCDTCTSSAPLDCTGCKTGYYKSTSGTGVVSCLSCNGNCKTCSSTDTTCSSCVDGKYLSSSTCQDCTSPCVKCSGSATTCTGCTQGSTYLDSNTCNNCPAGGNSAWDTAAKCSGCHASGTPTAFADHCYYGEDYCFTTTWTDNTGSPSAGYTLAKSCTLYSGSSGTAACDSRCAKCTVKNDDTKCTECASGKFKKTNPVNGVVQCVDACTDVTEAQICNEQDCGLWSSSTSKCTAALTCHANCNGCTRSSSNTHCKACATGKFQTAAATAAQTVSPYEPAYMTCDDACTDITDSSLCTSQKCFWNTGVSPAACQVCDGSCDGCIGSNTACTACSSTHKYSLTAVSSGGTKTCGNNCNLVTNVATCTEQSCGAEACTAACHINCATCKGSSDTECYTCKSTAFKQAEPTVTGGVITCTTTCSAVTTQALCDGTPTGYKCWWDTSANSGAGGCAACDSTNCDGTCAGAALTCRTCASTYYHDVDVSSTNAGTCVSGCSNVPQTYCTGALTGGKCFWNAATPACDDCDAACDGCTGTAATDCTGCATGYFWKAAVPAGTAGECINTCSGVTASTDCTGILTGYKCWWDAATPACTDCDTTNCDGTCDGAAATCRTCNTGYYHNVDVSSTNAGTCVNGCAAVTTQSLCTGTLTGGKCFWNSATPACDDCDAACNGCTGTAATDCTACAPTYFWKTAVPSGSSGECINTCTLVTDASLCLAHGCGEAVCGAAFTCDSNCDGCSQQSSNAHCYKCASGSLQNSAATGTPVVMTCVANCAAVTDTARCTGHNCADAASGGANCGNACSNKCAGCTVASDNTKCKACATGKKQRGAVANGVMTCDDACAGDEYEDSQGICQPCGGSAGGNLPSGVTKDTCNPTCARYWEGNSNLLTTYWRDRCLDCVSNCDACAVSSHTSLTYTPICSNCKSGYQLDNNECKLIDCSDTGLASITTQAACNVCVAKTGYVWDSANTACEKCPEHCLVCTATGTCTDCEAGWVHNSAGECVSCGDDDATACTNCGTSTTAQYYDSTNKMCGLCLSNCMECTSSTTCTKCRDGYWLTNTAGSPVTCTSCGSDCITCASSNTCSLCTDDKYPDGTVPCSQCPSNCIKCTAANSCDTCASGKWWDSTNNNCGNNCGNHCASCDKDTGCKTCDSGYYLENASSCKACTDSKCTLCTAASQCTTCQTGYYLNNNACTKCDSKCDECTFESGNEVCQKCKANYCRSAAGQCLGDKDCETCEATANGGTTCSLCKADHYREVCEPCGLAGCKICTKSSTTNQYSCTDCHDGYYLTAGTCTGCHVSCSKCQDNTGDCTECKSAYIPGYINPSNRQECIACIAHCDECDNVSECKKCKDGYYLKASDKKCYDCTDVDCISCSDEKQCDTCRARYYPTGTDGACDPCGTGCDACQKDGSTSVCNDCRDGYRMQNPATADCEACTDANCEDCDTDANVCEECDDGYFINSNDGCTLCTTGFANCADCEDVNGDDTIGAGTDDEPDTWECFECASGFYLDDEHKQCLSCSASISKCAECEDYHEECLDCGERYADKEAMKCHVGACFVCDSTSENCGLKFDSSKANGTWQGCAGDCRKYINGSGDSEAVWRECLPSTCNKHKCENAGADATDCCCDSTKMKDKKYEGIDYVELCNGGRMLQTSMWMSILLAVLCAFIKQ